MRDGAVSSQPIMYVFVTRPINESRLPDSKACYTPGERPKRLA
jgi:hypothetical protein